MAVGVFVAGHGKADVTSHGTPGLSSRTDGRSDSVSLHSLISNTSRSITTAPSRRLQRPSYVCVTLASRVFLAGTRAGDVSKAGSVACGASRLARVALAQSRISKQLFIILDSYVCAFRSRRFVATAAAVLQTSVQGGDLGFATKPVSVTMVLGSLPSSMAC